MLFTKQKSIAPISGLSNEILCILVAKRAAKGQGAKVVGQKKCLVLPWVSTDLLSKKGLDSGCTRLFFAPPNLNSIIYFHSDVVNR